MKALGTREVPEHIAPTVPPAAPGIAEPSLMAALPEYFRHLERRDASPHTITAYRRALLDFMAGVPEPFTGEGFRNWLRGLERRNLGPRSRGLHVAAVRAYARWHEREFETGRWTLILARRAPRYPRSLPEWFKPDQMARIFAHLEQRGDPAGWRNRALIELAYSTGARLSEVVRVNLGDVDLDAGDVLLHTKGRREHRVPLGRTAREALGNWLAFRRTLPAPDPNAVFVSLSGRSWCRRLTSRGLQEIFAAVTKAVFGRAVRFHALRHSVGSHMLDRGAPLRAIQELLGHSNINCTAQYCHIAVTTLHRTYERAHPTGERYEPPAASRPVPLPPGRVLLKGDLSQRLLAHAYQSAAMREVCNR